MDWNHFLFAAVFDVNLWSDEELSLVCKLEELGFPNEISKKAIKRHSSIEAAV